MLLFVPVSHLFKYSALVFLVAFLAMHSSALSAVPVTSMHVGIGNAVDVAMFTSDLVSEGASLQIYEMCNRLQVVRVNAVADSAFVVKFQSFWDRSYQYSVNGNMSQCVLSVVPTGTVTSSLLFRPGPKPTAVRFGNLCPDGTVETKPLSYTTSEVAFTATAVRNRFPWRELNFANSTRPTCDGPWSTSPHTNRITQTIVRNLGIEN